MDAKAPGAQEGILIPLKLGAANKKTCDWEGGKKASYLGRMRKQEVKGVGSL